MCYTFKKNKKQTKRPVNCFLQDDASAGIQSLQTSIEIKLPKTHGMDYTIEGKRQAILDIIILIYAKFSVICYLAGIQTGCDVLELAFVQFRHLSFWLLCVGFTKSKPLDLEI